MNKITGGQAVVRALTLLNVDTIFGMPGIHNLAIYTALLDSSIHHVTVRHEQGAGFMADGYARCTGKVGVALVISGPGLTNILTPMAEAYQDAVPLLVISSHIPTRYLGGHTGNLHELAQSTSMVQSVAKQSRRVPTTQAIAPYLMEAHQLALEGRPGPVHIEIPMDLLEKSLPMPSDDELSQVMSLFKAPSSAPVSAILTQAVTALNKAKRPLMVLGGGAWQACDTLTSLAENGAIPVLLSPAAKGSMDESHPLCIGVRHHFLSVRKYTVEADVVLAVGTELSEDLYGNPFNTSGVLIRVDLDPSAFECNLRANICLEGDADRVAKALLSELPAKPERLEPVCWEVAEIKKKAAQEIESMFRYPNLSLMVEMLEAMRTALPTDAILVADSTCLAYLAYSEYPAFYPRTFVYPCGFGTLGMALPAGIGIKIAQPAKSVCVLVGDGGFQYTMAELGTACQENLTLPIVLWNDDGFGEIRTYQEARHPGRHIGVDLKNPDFIALADAYGISRHPVTTGTEMQNALTRSLSSVGPSLIVVSATSLS